MAKYNITYICSHEETIELFGKHDGRDREIARREKQKCFACYQAAKNEAAMQVVASVSAEVALPALVGSPKQIAWAEKIRAAAIAVLIAKRETERRIKDAPFRGAPAERYDAAIAELDERIERAAGEVSAKWWIDHR